MQTDGTRHPRPGAALSSPTLAEPVQASFDDLSTPLIDVTFAVLDLETTGLSPTDDRITEVGVVKCRAGEVLGEFATLVNPGRSVPAAVSAVTGIADHMLAARPPIEAVLPALVEFLRGTGRPQCQLRHALPRLRPRTARLPPTGAAGGRHRCGGPPDPA